MQGAAATPSRKGMQQGIREKERLASLARLTAAARELFVEIGYEGATLRKIAERSGMALGTLFHYIADKRDLIFLIFNEELDRIAEKALAAIRPDQGFRANLLKFTEPFYRFLAREPELSRILLREIQQQSAGPHLARFLQMQERMLGALKALVTEAKRSNEIQCSENSGFIALTIFFCFSSASRWWIATPNPKWFVGHREFGRTLNIIVDGLAHASVSSYEHPPSRDNKHG